MRITLFLCIVVMLTGCGAAAVETTTDNQPAATIEIEQSPEVSQPTATPKAATETTQPTATSARVTETLQPSATSAQATVASQPTATPEPVATSRQPEATTPAPASSGDVVAVWTRSGGFAGLHEVLTVFADGRLSLEQRGGAKTGQAAPADFERLQQTIAGPGWQQLEKQYGVQHPDAFQYTIQAKGKIVETFDGSDYPDVLMDLLQQFQALHQTTVSN